MNIIREIKCANWIGHILHRNCLLKHIAEWKKEVTGRRGQRRKQIPAGLKEMKGYRKPEEEATDRTVYGTCLASSYEPVAIQNME